MSHRQYFSLLVASVFALSSLAGCSSAYDEETPASLAFYSEDITDGILALHKGDSTLIGVRAFNANGDKLDSNPAEFNWGSGDESVLLAKSLGSTALITGESDWFDTTTSGKKTVPGHEPSVTLHVSYGSGPDAPSAKIGAFIVLDVAGRWRADIEGLGSQELTLTQQGRKVSYLGNGTDASGLIAGDQFTLEQQGFVLNGTFTSQTEVSGTYTGPLGLTGAWSARKID